MAHDFVTLFDRFRRHRKFVNNYSENTLIACAAAWRLYRRLIGDDITKASLQEFVVKMREAGKTPATCNTHIKSINGYLNWLKEFEYVPSDFHIKSIKATRRIVEPAPDETLRRIINWKPKERSDHRMYAMLCLMIDTGVRIDEALTLKRSCVDLDNLLIKVVGKGSKERLIPISFECAKILTKYLRRHNFELVFCTTNGTKCNYQNLNLQLKHLLADLGVGRAGFHRIRHAFATGYLRNGGNLLYLQRVLGHASLNTTKIYVHVETSDLQREHVKLSPLSKLR
jgi:integrase/recombinase XerD